MKIFLIGFMGSGKSYLGKKLSEKLRLPFFDLDAEIESNEGKSINQLFDEKGEEYFRLREKDYLHLITESHESFIMATGGGTPCYYNNIDYMNLAGTTVWINSTIDILFDRLLKEKSKRPLLKGLDETQLKGFIQKKFSDRKIYYEQAAISVDDNNESLEKILNKIFHE
jgi:shikimate kinase